MNLQSAAEPPQRSSPTAAEGVSPAASRQRWLYVAIAFAVGIVFLPLLAHPTWVVFDGSGDLIRGHLPYRVLLARSVRNLDGLPAYDATAFAGIPLAADPQANLTYPPNWLHALSDDGAPAVFGWLMLVHLLIGGWGVLYWLGRRGFDPAARLTGALVFTLAGKWLHHVLSTGQVNMLPLAWVPWQILLIDRLVVRTSWRDAAWLALATSLVVQGSHPQITLYTQVLVAGYALLALVASRKIDFRRSLAVLALAGGLGIALSAWYLLPILDGLDFFVRGEGFGAERAGKGAIAPGKLIHAIVPGSLVGSSKSVIFIGSAVLALAVFSVARRRGRSTTVFFLAAFLLSAAYSLGSATWLHGFVHQWVPGFSLFRLPTRMMLISGLPLAWLAASGVMVLREQSPSRPLQICAVAMLLVGLALVVRQPGADAAWAAAGLALPLLLVVGCATRVGRRAVWVVVFVLACQLLRFASSLAETHPVSEVLASNALPESLRQPLGRGRILSMNASHNSSNPFRADVNALNGLEGLRGYNPLVPRRTLELLREGSDVDAPVRANLPKIPIKRLVGRTRLDLLNTQWVIAPRPIDVDWLEFRGVHKPPPRAKPDRWKFQAGFDTRRFVYENTTRMPRAALVRRARRVASREEALAEFDRFDPRSEVLVEDSRLVAEFPGDFQAVAVERQGDRLDLEVDAGQGAYLVVSEFDYSGWRARVDGESAQLHRANGFFLGLRLEAGRHEIELAYRPRAVVVGFWVTLAALLATVWLLAVGRDRDPLGPHTAASGR